MCLTKDGQSLTEMIQAISSDETTIDVKVSAVVNGNIVSETKTYKKETGKKLAEFFIKPAYAGANYTLCVDLCNFLCSIGVGYFGCTASCALVTGPALPLCPFVCAVVVWFGCNYGCPQACTAGGF